jgi:gas vesicle protein
MPAGAGSGLRKIIVGFSMIKKKAYSIQMSYEVSDAEKKQAEQALLCFSAALKILQQASDHLNIMKTPFKDNPEMSPDEVMKARAAIRRFRDKAIENFNDFKEVAFKCVNAMQMFASDTQSVKLMKSMITAIDELEVKVNDFGEVFEDLQSNDFSKDVVSAIEDVQKQCDDIEEIIDERIKPHIQNEILATSWVDSVSQDLQMKVEKKTPLIMDLYNKRQDQLNDALKERGTVGN